MKLTLPYLPPHDTPLRWMDEQSGQLTTAVHTFIDTGLGRATATPAHLEMVRAYCDYYINAPCWVSPDIDEQTIQEIMALRTQVTEATTFKALDVWIHECLKVGLDPL